MAVLYLHTAPPPKLAQTDAGYQETSMLKSRFGGVELSLFPFRHPSRLLPRAAYGWHLRERLQLHEARLLLNHVFMPSVQHYPILKVLNNPTILSIQAGIDHMTERKCRHLEKVAKVVVNNPRDAAILEKWGIDHHVLVHPGVATDHISTVPAGRAQPFTLLMASAPWEKGQFASKGIDFLLKATSKRSDLKLILLWRGTLFNELQERIRRWGVEDRVQVINEVIDINQIMPEVHAVVLLASATNLVKAYPHSLVEGLAAGKPLLTSPAIPMSDYIQSHNLGEVLSKFTLQSLLESIEYLRQHYDQKRSAVLAKGASDFDSQRMLDEMDHI
ncbi:MAG: glycosyltransferase, partial [Saprospiraceae bacterium]|nr:glycosyltransferase [Saprospiraceae bacterium]